MDQPVLIDIAPRRPVLRWHGGKWRLAPWVIEHLPPHKIYVEPYGGAASVLMRKPRSFSEVYNDRDDAVVTLFRVLRNKDAARRLAELCRLTPWARTEFNDAYVASEDDLEIARSVIVRAFMGFGTSGLTRSRTGFRGRAIKGNRTGVTDWKNYADCIPTFVDRLQGVIVENRPAVDVIAEQDSSETLFYVDPPYPHGTRTGNNFGADSGRGYAHEMSDGDHRKLAQVLHLIKGMAIVSGYHSDLYDNELFHDWKCIETDACADGGKKRVECLWINPAAQEALKS